MNSREIKRKAKDIIYSIPKFPDEILKRTEVLINSDHSDYNVIIKYVTQIIDEFIMYNFTKKAIFLIKKYNLYYDNIFTTALQEDDDTIVLLFMKSNLNSMTSNPISKAIGSNIKFVKPLIKKFPKFINYSPNNTMLPLRYAIQVYDRYKYKDELLDIIKLLLKSGAIINGNNSIFRFAVKNSPFEVINLLLLYYKKSDFNDKELANISRFISSKIRSDHKQAIQWNKLFNIVNDSSLYGKRR